MNVTMPAPAPTAPPATAPSDRIAARERTTTTPSERRTDDERTFEEQLDEVAVALASTRYERVEAHTKPHTTSGRAANVPTAFAAPLASTAPTSPTSAGTAGAAGATPADPAVATPPVALADPVVTEIEGPHAPLAAAPTTQVPSAPAVASANALSSTSDTPTPAPTDPTTTGTMPTATTEAPAPSTTGATTTGIVPPTTTDTPTPPTTNPTATGIVPPTTTDTPTPPTTNPTATDPTATEIVPTTTTDTPTPTTTDPTATGIVPTTTDPVPTSDSDTPSLTLSSPVDTGPIATRAATDGGADPAPQQTSLGAASKVALDAAVDAAIDNADAGIDDVAGIDSADTAGADATTPPVILNPASSVRRADTSATPASGPAPVIGEAADDLAPPFRLAPPRTIAVDLNDEGLGPLRVVATTEQRTVHLTVSAGEAIVRDALVRQQTDLRNDLAEAGLQLGSFEVDDRAADRDQTDQPALTSDSDRDRPTARSAAAPAATVPVHDTHGADGHLDLRL